MLNLSSLRGVVAAAWARGRDGAAAIDQRLSLHPRLPTVMHRPGVRGMARRRAAALFDLCAGFVYSQVLVACVELDLFALLAERPRHPDEIAARLGLTGDATGRLLGAAAALRLLHRRRDGRYGLGPLGAAVAADPGIAAMVAHHHLLYADLADPVAFLRDQTAGSRLGDFWPYGSAVDGAPTGPYTALMAASQTMVARQVLAVVPFEGCRKLLDLGGGNGAFLRAVAARHPHVALALVDLPAVAAEARRSFAVAGMAADVAEGDLRDAPFPDGVDAVSLVRVLHDHDDAYVRMILANVRRRLPAGGLLVIAEPMADVPGAERVGNAYFPFYLKAMGAGRTRSPTWYAELLAACGFERIAQPKTPLPLAASVVIARAPSGPRNVPQAKRSSAPNSRSV